MEALLNRRTLALGLSGFVATAVNSTAFADESSAAASRNARCSGWVFGNDAYIRQAVAISRRFRSRNVARVNTRVPLDCDADVSAEARKAAAYGSARALKRPSPREDGKIFESLPSLSVISLREVRLRQAMPGSGKGQSLGHIRP